MSPGVGAGCTHPGSGPLREGMYACPIGTCRCCGHRFAYVDSGSWTQRKENGRAWMESHSRHHDSDLCDACGGRYHETSSTSEPTESPFAQDERTSGT